MVNTPQHFDSLNLNPDRDVCENGATKGITATSSHFGHRLKLIVAAGGSVILTSCGTIISALAPDDEGPWLDSGADSGWKLPDPADEDGDGYYTDVRGVPAPAESLGYDCNDANPLIHAGADEVCEDQIDNNCDREIDDPLAVDANDWWPDMDNDGYGAMNAVPVHGCEGPVHPTLQIRYVTNGDDCDDHDAALQANCSE